MRVRLAIIVLGVTLGLLAKGIVSFFDPEAKQKTAVETRDS